jgi:hypothetical protein
MTVLNTEIQKTQETSEARAHMQWLAPCIALLLMAVTFYAYAPTLFNFFCGDDYIHVEWLKRAVHEPALVWKNFYTTWLDDKCSLYYRPLISVFNYCDYIVWGENGLGFRITNIAFLLAASVFLGCIVSELADQKSEDSKMAFHQWGVLAAFLFALYPLHPEAVAWITGRVDSVVAAFYLASVWCYIRWRHSLLNHWLVLTGVTMILALLSKEMGLSLPLAYFFYELVYNRNRAKISKQVVLVNGMFWVMLALYFAMRQMFLGSMVGGWDSSLSVGADPQKQLSIWTAGLEKMLVPINFMALGSRHWLAMLWKGLVVGLSCLGLIRIGRDENRSRAAVFLLLLMAACLLPVYKVFNVSGGLESSRYAYLATAPLCALLTLWFGQGTSPKESPFYRNATYASYAFAAGLLLCSFALLRINLDPWAQAGREANALKAGIASIEERSKDNLPLLLMQIPDNYKGAYICRNALIGMSPNSGVRLWGFPSTPFGLLRDNLKKVKDAVLVCRWDHASEKFIQVNANIEEKPPLAKTWSGQALKEIIGETNLPETASGVQIQTDKNVVLHLQPKLVPPAQTHYIGLEFTDAKKPIDATRFDLHFSNECSTSSDVQGGEVQIDGKPMVVFSLHGNFEWAFGETLKELALVIPPGIDATLSAVQVIAPERIMPTLVASNRNLLLHDGLAYVSNGNPVEIKIDASGIKEASELKLQITKENYMFNRFNYPITNPVAMLGVFKLPSLKSGYSIRRELFPGPGFYELRAVAFDKNGKLAGVPGDHMLLMAK